MNIQLYVIVAHIAPNTGPKKCINYSFVISAKNNDGAIDLCGLNAPPDIQPTVLPTIK